ncbi:MAG: sigma-70 family RNA polymerase sigma factor [Opitutaceae bacterium]|nr:sigma-70 family RNA polymerase sigma factor [Opitutaceae bacterium]
MSQQDLDTARWFAAEVHPHEPALRSYLRSHFPTLRDIDDLVQETYARLIQARRSGRVADARPYLFSIARNAAIDLCRRNRVVAFEPIAKMAEPFVDIPDEAAVDSLDRDQELALLSAAIATLPERCRRVLTLRKLHGFSHRAIAEQFGISENTVSAQITLGIFRVREYFRARGVARTGSMPAPRNSSAVNLH